jgi:hypothetical protein
MRIGDGKFEKRLRKKVLRGLRGWPLATIAYYGPDLSRASKVAVGIIQREGGHADEMRTWVSADDDVRRDPVVCEEVLKFLDQHDIKSVAVSGSIIGCPHEEGIDYTGEWCPLCTFWRGRDRFTGKLLS